MMIKKNELDLKEFASINWKKENPRHRNFHNQILAWLLNPYSDHNLEYCFLESFILKSGLKRDMARPLLLLSHNSEPKAYATEAGSIDVILETGKGYLLIENRLTLTQGEADQYLVELKAKAGWFKDNLRRNKLNRILLLVPSGHIPPPLAEYIERSTFIVPLVYQRLVDIMSDLLLYDIHYNTHKKLYGALERYKLFLQTYVVDIYHEEQLRLRLENLNAII